MSFFVNNLNIDMISEYNRFLGDSINRSSIGFKESKFEDFERILESSCVEVEGGSKLLKGLVQKKDGENSLFESSIVKSIDSSDGVDSLSDVESFANGVSSSLANSLNSVNDLQKSAENAVCEFACGGDIDVHQVMIASEKSNLAMQMSIQLTNKMLQAYNEINQIKV